MICIKLLPADERKRKDEQLSPSQALHPNLIIIVSHLPNFHLQPLRPPFFAFIPTRKFLSLFPSLQTHAHTFAIKQKLGTQYHLSWNFFMFGISFLICFMRSIFWVLYDWAYFSFLNIKHTFLLGIYMDG